MNARIILTFAAIIWLGLVAHAWSASIDLEKRNKDWVGRDGCQEGRCDEEVRPNHNGTELYLLRVITNKNLSANRRSFRTEHECTREGTYLEYAGKIRSFTCIPGRGPLPEELGLSIRSE